MCVDQCRLSSGYCEESCDNADRQCVEKVQQQALKDYRKYTEEQYAAGQPMDLSLHDFERMTPCNDGQAACYNKCENAYGLCYGKCGGKVEVAPSCSSFCF